jgi:hypothetical protein
MQFNPALLSNYAAAVIQQVGATQQHGVAVRSAPVYVDEVALSIPPYWAWRGGCFQPDRPAATGIGARESANVASTELLR